MKLAKNESIRAIASVAVNLMKRNEVAVKWKRSHAEH